MTAKRRPGRPRVKPAEQRRDDLLNAADRLFRDQGFAATSVDQITVAAGVAKGTYYLYFTSKDDIRAALAERLALRHLETLKQAVDTAPDHPVEAWVEACLALRFEWGVHPLLVDHLTDLLTPVAEQPRAMAVFLISGVQAMIGESVEPAQIKALCARLTGGQQQAPRPPKPASAPKRPEVRQGSLF